MKKQDSWNSEFRKKRFYERQKTKWYKEFSGYNTEIRHTIPQTIAIMLDLDGTTDFIDDEKAKLFIKQLEILRVKFGAQLGTISISTHYRDSIKMQNVLDILARNLTKNIKIGISFYYGGTYDYDKKEDTYQEYSFNSNKVSTFDNYYVNSIGMNNQWFAIIDDNISEDVWKKYQNNHPMLLCRPSQYDDNLKSNCFMSIATTTKGFDGVLESLNSYISFIKNLSPEQILEKQRNMITHLSSYEVTNKIRSRNYSFIERYFTEGYADDADYQDALDWIIYTNSDQTPTKAELIQLKKILQAMSEKFQLNNDEQNIEKIKKLQRAFKQLHYGC